MNRASRLKFTFDSNCLIALLHLNHVHHQTTKLDFERRLNRGDVLHLIPHTLLEAFSVLTRIPVPFRRSASEVHSLLRKNFGEFQMIETPGSQEVWNLLAQLAASEIGGGRTYDSWIALTANNAGMQEFVTWNAKHFPRDRFQKLRIVEPSAS